MVFRYQTLPQKIVQARMWAQGLTVGVLLASAGLSASSAPRHATVDHSWALIVSSTAFPTPSDLHDCFMLRSLKNKRKRKRSKRRNSRFPPDSGSYFSFVIRCVLCSCKLDEATKKEKKPSVSCTVRCM